MFSDPHNVQSLISVLTAGTPYSFVATERAADHSTYRYTDSGTGVDIVQKLAHQYGKRNRFTYRFDMSDIIAVPLDPSLNQKRTTSVYVVWDVDPIGLPPLLYNVGNGIAGFCASVAGADPGYARLLAGET